MDNNEEYEQNFDDIYADELELMMEDDDLPPPTKKKPPESNKNTGNLNLCSQSQINSVKTQEITTDSTISTPSVSNTAKSTTDNNPTPKRSLQELFGDIDDLLLDSPFIEAPFLKKSKQSRKTEDLDLIEHIVQLRKAARDNGLSHSGFKGRNGDVAEFYEIHANISYTMPKWPFLRVKKHDSRDMFVRFHSEEFENREIDRMVKKFSFEAGVLTSTFKQTWIEAKNILKQQEDLKELSENIPANSQLTELQSLDTKSLWVEKYKPTKYMELLSDESTNRVLLRWLKLWDKVVFNRKTIVKPTLPKPEETNDKFKKFQRKEVILKLDEEGRPEFKVALLCGPPGLGKTTLAHLVAKHAGYNAVEVNASDDRSVDSFRTALEHSTQMRSVLDRENRPNCLIFDEIDGAPSASIDFLIKYINGTYRPPKPKKAKSKKTTTTQLKRPIICICNDVYVPALRPLRQISFLVNFPPTESNRLAQRLQEICLHQTIKTNLTTLVALSEKSNNDIRSCLSVLQFFKAQDRPVRLSDVLASAVGQKDIQRGLFAIWQDIFQIKRTQGNSKDNVVTVKSRAKSTLDAITSFGDYERVAQGVWENYPMMKVKGRDVDDICESLEWFGKFDLIQTRILTTQNYSMSAYLGYAFVVWHLVFGSTNWQKITYPNKGYEVRTQLGRNTALVAEILKGTQPTLKPYLHKKCLGHEILPYLSEIILPSFRPVNISLYSDKEKRQMHDIITKMIDYNITYIQERTIEGEYVYNLDPNIDELVKFTTSVPRKKVVSYSNKQLLAREIDLEKMRRSIQFKTQHSKDEPKKSISKAAKSNPGEKESQLPNHLQKLKVTTMVKASKTVERDIFGNVLKKSQCQKTVLEISNDVWFQYKEGFTNAVRRTIKIKDLK